MPASAIPCISHIIDALRRVDYFQEFFCFVFPAQISLKKLRIFLFKISWHCNLVWFSKGTFIPAISSLYNHCRTQDDTIASKNWLDTFLKWSTILGLCRKKVGMWCEWNSSFKEWLSAWKIVWFPSLLYDSIPRWKSFPFEDHNWCTNFSFYDVCF